MSTPAAISNLSNGLSTDTSRLASKDNLDAAGKRFEAIFTGMMLKSMRAAKLGDGLFDSKASEQFRDMQDQQLATAMAAHAPIGIGKAMTEFLAKSASSSFSGEGRVPVPTTPGGPDHASIDVPAGPRPAPGNSIADASRSSTP